MLIPNRYPFERVLKTELMRRTSRGKTEGSEVQGAASGSPKVLKVLRLVGHSCPPPPNYVRVRNGLPIIRTHM